MLAFILLLLGGYVVYFAASFYRRVSKLPPGPTPLPLIGNLHNKIERPMMFRHMEKMARQYGSVFTLHIPFPVVNISDYEAMKTALKSDDFAGRHTSLVTKMINFSKECGVLQSSGDVWREQRRTTISILRDFGMGKYLMEEKVHLSAETYINCLKNQKDMDRVDMRWPVQLFVANVISDILFARRYPAEKSQELLDYVDGFLAFFVEAAASKWFLLGNIFPFLRHVPIIKEHVHDVFKRKWDKGQEYLVKEVDQARASFNDDDEPQCFTHAFMKELKTNPMLSEPQMYDCCKDLFMAGQETTTTTLRWAMLFMAAHQEVQDKVRAEIRSVVGSTGGKLYMKDKSRMPYTSATILEIQRRANIIPFNFGIVHCATVDSEINGMHIPKNTTVNPDIHQVLSCDPHFKEPERFWPERYLMANGKTLNKVLVDRTIAFGIGKRACAGEGIARVELFIGLTSTLMNFQVLPPFNADVNLTPQYLNIHLPHHHELRLLPLS